MPLEGPYKAQAHACLPAAPNGRVGHRAAADATVKGRLLGLVWCRRLGRRRRGCLWHARCFERLGVWGGRGGARLDGELRRLVRLVGGRHGLLVALDTSALGAVAAAARPCTGVVLQEQGLAKADHVAALGDAIGVRYYPPVAGRRLHRRGLWIGCCVCHLDANYSAEGAAAREGVWCEPRWVCECRAHWVRWRRCRCALPVRWASTRT